MVFIGIIPARYASTRFPGKPLALINGKPMIQLVYEKAKLSLSEVWVATDDQRIFDVVTSFGGKVVKTSENHKSGTDRCAEAAHVLAEDIKFDVVINIQGDEPFIETEQIDLLKSCFLNNAEIATLIKPIKNTEELFDPNKPKVVINNKKNAIYFSRSPIPFSRDSEKQDWVSETNYWGHVGMYAYKNSILQKITKLPQSQLEKAESLEQLRWIENGYSITTAITESNNFGIDTPADLEKALQLFK